MIVIRLSIRRIFVQHVRISSFHLSIQYRKPQLASINLLYIHFLFLIFQIAFLKLFTIGSHQISTLGRTEKRPNTLLLHTLHKQIRNPQSIKQITRTMLLFARILLQIKNTFDINMPWFDIHSKRTLSFSTSLVHIARSLVIYLQHGNKSIALSTTSTNIRTSTSNISNR